MAMYTMRLQELIEGLTLADTGLNTRDRIEKARKKLFNFEYSFFDPVAKKDFETNFIRKFFMNEIGFETEGLFRFQLESWLLEHMKYYNQLFKSELIIFDPLKNTNLKTTHDKQNDNKKNDTLKQNQSTSSEEKGYAKTNQAESTKMDQTVDGESSDTGRNFNRELTAQVGDNRLAITTENGSGIIEYASDIKENLETTKNDGTTKQTSNADGLNIKDETTNSTNDASSALTASQNAESLVKLLEEFAQLEEGKTGTQTYSKMLTEYRETFLRIQTQMFNEMRCLFMGIY